jgi:hypothetical protein
MRLFQCTEYQQTRLTVEAYHSGVTRGGIVQETFIADMLYCSATRRRPSVAGEFSFPTLVLKGKSYKLRLRIEQICRYRHSRGREGKLTKLHKM